MLAFLLRWPWWAAFPLTVTVLGAAEIGYRLGRLRPDAAADRKGQVSVHAAAILALLGLLLAFSFSIVEARFSARKRLVIDEANAIGTTWLRARLLPAPHGERIQKLLRRYVALRIGAEGPEELAAAIARSEEIHAELWREAEAVGEAHPESVPVGLFLFSLNEVIDLHTTRVAVGLHQRLPTAIVDVLVLVSILAMGVLGYGAGLGQWRSLIPTVALVLAVAAVLVLIGQLDSPGTPLFRVSQYAMEEVHQTMEADAARAAW